MTLYTFTLALAGTGRRLGFLSKERVTWVTVDTDIIGINSNEINTYLKNWTSL